MADLPLPPPAPPQWPMAKRPLQWPTIAWRVLTLVAIGLAIGSWFRPLPDNKPPATPTFTDQQVADAKAGVCAVHEKVHDANKASSAQARGTDPTSQFAFAMNGRQALLAGSEYLLTTLAEEPATPSDLAKAVRDLANVFQELTVDYLNGQDNSQLEPVLSKGDRATSTIERLCK